MPKPVYILCAENITQDRETNLVSISNVIEKFDVTGIPVDLGQLPNTDELSKKLAQTANIDIGGRPLMKVIAVWALQPGDEGQEFETGMMITSPGKPDMIVGPMPFQFGEGGIYQRAILTVGGLPPLQSGTITVVSRMRKKGETAWKTQSYDIVVEAAIKQL